jgi:hypothetical protein
VESTIINNPRVIWRVMQLGYHMQRACLGVVLTLGLNHPGMAADVSSGRPAIEPAAIVYAIDGPITPRTVQELKQYLHRMNFGGGSVFGQRAVVTLNSTDGDFEAALALAEIFSSRGIETVVAAGASCLGPCAIAFLGGSVGAEEGSTTISRTLAVGGKLGFHAPALDLPDGTISKAVVESAYEVTLSQIARLVASDGMLSLRARLFPVFLTTGPGNFRLITNVADLGDFEIATSRFAQPSHLTGSMATNLCRNAYFWSEGVHVSEEDIDVLSDERMVSFTLIRNDPFGDHAGTVRTVVPTIPGGEGSTYYCLIDHASRSDGLKVLCRGFIVANDPELAANRARTLDPDRVGSVDLECNLPDPIDSLDPDSLQAVMNSPPIYAFAPAATPIYSIDATIAEYLKNELPIKPSQ